MKHEERRSKGPSEGPNAVPAPATSLVIDGARLFCYREIASRLSRPTTDNNEAARDCAHSQTRTREGLAFSRRRRPCENKGRGDPIGILVKQSGHFAPWARPPPLPITTCS